MASCLSQSNALPRGNFDQFLLEMWSCAWDQGQESGRRKALERGSMESAIPSTVFVSGASGGRQIIQHKKKLNHNSSPNIIQH
jgi:hypothetical protein